MSEKRIRKGSRVRNIATGHIGTVLYVKQGKGKDCTIVTVRYHTLKDTVRPGIYATFTTIDKRK